MSSLLHSGPPVSAARRWSVARPVRGAGRYGAKPRASVCAWRATRCRTPRAKSSCPDLSPPADLIQMPKQVGGIFVDADGAGALQLLLPIAAREQAYAERAAAAGGQHVPDRIAHDDRVLD